MNEIQRLVDNCIDLYEMQKIPELQNELHKLYSHFNKPHSGILITGYPRKDQLAECFTMMLQFDWMNDKDIREVWAENGFYCSIKYMQSDVKNQEDRLAIGLNLFLHLYESVEDIKHQVSYILRKAEILNNQIFDYQDYQKGSDWIVAQFIFLSANIIRPVVEKHNILKNKYLEAYNDILSIESLYLYPPQVIFAKAKFISSIIESILEDM